MKIIDPNPATDVAYRSDISKKLDWKSNLHKSMHW